MKPVYIQRKVPKYSTISYLLHYSYKNEYPKNAEKFIWGIPSKYRHIKDREISAIISAYIYDGTKRSLMAAQSVDEMFNGKPFEWLAMNRHNDMMLEQNQMRQIYKRTTNTDLYWLFRELKTLYAQYGSIRNRFNLFSLPTLQENIRHTLSVLTPFNTDDVIELSRRNMFFIMMSHIFNDYRLDESQLLAPMYSGLICTCGALGLITKSPTLKKESLTELTDNLRWFSENHPITFWVGILGYLVAVNENDKDLQCLAKKPLVRHRFKKR